MARLRNPLLYLRLVGLASAALLIAGVISIGTAFLIGFGLTTVQIVTYRRTNSPDAR